ncbi:MAG: LytTR family transcriptional regulator DNA-binding domain-containing protein [Ruminiclostridium sp.]|nr:LytTR family transcriptional regulator DNA-binding domain-containing protein [Ruminiclostridium sp.]
MLKYKICVLVSDIRTHANESYLVGIEKGADSLGFSTVTYSMLQLSELFSNNEEQVYNLINFDDYDGVIVIASSFGAHPELLDKFLDRIKSECNIPVVSIGEMEGVHNTKFSDAHSSICEKLTDHLIEEHNCETLYVLGGTKNSIKSMAEGIGASYEKHGKDHDNVSYICGGYWTDCAERLVKDIASGAMPMPDAIFCIYEVIANALIYQLYSYGYCVPRDTRVVSISRKSDAQQDLLPITKASYHGDLRGYNAVATLYNMITGENAPRKKLPPPTITMGASCGCNVELDKNLRFKFEKIETNNHNEMLFRNSFIEERLLTTESMPQFIYEIKNLEYLVANAKYVNISTLTDDPNMAINIYVSDQNTEKLPSKPFKASKLFSDDSFLEDEKGDSTFTYVLPLIFNKRMHGFMAIVYDTPIVYDKLTLQFAKVMSIALERLKQLEEVKKQVRDQLMTETTPAIQQTTPDIEVHYQASSEDDISIFANKNGVMCKVVVENILYFEATGGKIYVALKSGKYETKQKLFEIEEQLSARGFLRISKSVIINMNKVVNFRPGDDRTIIVKLSNNEEIKVTRSYAKDFRDKMKF